MKTLVLAVLAAVVSASVAVAQAPAFDPTTSPPEGGTNPHIRVGKNARFTSDVISLTVKCVQVNVGPGGRQLAEEEFNRCMEQVAANPHMTGKIAPEHLAIVMNAVATWVAAYSAKQHAVLMTLNPTFHLAVQSVTDTAISSVSSTLSSIPSVPTPPAAPQPPTGTTPAVPALPGDGGESTPAPQPPVTTPPVGAEGGGYTAPPQPPVVTPPVAAVDAAADGISGTLVAIIVLLVVLAMLVLLVLSYGTYWFFYKRTSQAS